ncbi:MAG: PKD domain-containing protein [Candidatus Bathyarchaeota archaeon]|nr:PKD domain-containing protein [Candidatus Bathyarchaeota archaeon]
MLFIIVVNTESAYANNLPTAVLPSQEHTCNEGDYLSIQLNGSGSYDPEGNSLHYRWDIGNTGVWTPWSTSAVTSITRQFLVNTTIEVKLKVTDGLLESTTTATVSVTVNNLPPTVNAGPDIQAYPNIPVEFKGNYSDPGNDVTEVTWDFGDGTTATGTLLPTHIYTATGDYTVSLIVTDAQGATATDQLLVQVQTRPSSEVCDASGNPKSVFWENEQVYVKGIDLPPNTDIPVYVVSHTTWSDGLPLSSLTWQSGALVYTDSSGAIVPTMIWEPRLLSGYYDVFIDVNSNSVYDEGTDKLINFQLDESYGFFVTPETPFGALAPFLAGIAAFGIFKLKKQE